MCDLDRHSVKGPGVDATYHVPSARGTGFQLRLKLDFLPWFDFTMRSFPAFLLSKAGSNLILRSCREAMFITFPCHAVSSPRSRLSVVKWQSTFPHGLADELDHF